MVGLFFADCQRRKQAHGVFAGSSGEDAVVEEQLLAEFRCRSFDFHTDHKSAASHVAQSGYLGEFVEQVFACGCGVLDEFFIAHSSSTAMAAAQAR